MTLLPLTLGVRRTPDAERSVSSSVSRLDKKKAEQTLRRDDFSCRFCGFHAQQFQRIIYCEEAGNPPFATACGFCEQCMMLDRTGLAAAGVLIWLPEISQVELQHVVRAIYVARAAKGPIGEAASRTFDALMARRTEAKKRLGSDDPLLLATAMHESLSDEHYQSAGKKLEGIRLLSLDKHMVRTRRGDINQFPQMVKYWFSSTGPFAKLPVDQWADLFKTASATAGHA